VKISDNFIQIAEKNYSEYLDVWIEYHNASSTLSIDSIELSLAGMTHNGIDGITYQIDPAKIDLSRASKIQSKIRIEAQDNIRSGVYDIMLQVSIPEKSDKNLKVSVLQPIEMPVQIPEEKIIQDSEKQQYESGIFSEITVKDVIQTVALLVAAGLSALIILRRIKLAKKNKVE